MARATQEVFRVLSDRVEIPVRHFDSESGTHYYVSHWAYLVSFGSRFGHEYIHMYQFPDDADGARRAARFALRVQAKLNAEGVDSLDLTHWGVRTVYGSEAYSAEESDIVEREKYDALLNEGCG